MSGPATPVTLADVRAARDRIASGIMRTPCPESRPLSELTGARIFCKLDLLQRTGSFKERGARHALLLLDERQRGRGVIAASAGNHALGLAYHGGLLGIPVTVVMPRFAPLVKLATCRRLGARVILKGDTFAEAREAASSLAAREGLELIHGFDDPRVIAGQGTMALEILEDVPEAGVLVVPTGGAGLLAGVGLVAKALRPEITIVAAEPAAAPTFSASLAAGRPVAVPIRPTLADGLAVGRVGDVSFPIAAAGASVREIVHDRAFAGPDVFATGVEVTVETADREHVAALVARLEAEGFDVTPATRPPCAD
jgi:threonine dehydratase